MRRYSSRVGAALSLTLAVTACSDGTEFLLRAQLGISGSDAGSVAGSSSEVPPMSGGSGGLPSASGGSSPTPTAGSGSEQAGSTGDGGSSPGSGGMAPGAGSSNGGSESMGGSEPMGGSQSMGGSEPMGGSAPMGGSGGSAPSGPFKVLIISTALEFAHETIKDCQKMVKELGAADATNGWTTEVETNALPHFVTGGLKDYALIFSCNPTGRVFSGNPAVADKAGAMKAFQDFIETEGKAFAGVHSASDFEKTNGFPWFTNVLMGAYFVSHEVTAGSVVSDSQNTTHPVLAGLASNYSTRDEWYRMNRDPGSQPGFKVLQRLASDSRPLTWVKDVGAGRMFYTVRGHAESVYTEAPFRAVVKNGILWTTRRN
jgi:type 1 glutamine amidotransferase